MSDAVVEETARIDLIREVFIDPIRTVVVVDDEFPALDALVLNELKENQRVWKDEDLRRVKGILEFARTKERPWLVDIHDAQRIKVEADERIAPHLNHSDLMVLDYHLEGDAGSGDASIKILRQLALNGHHNLVVIYTKGFDGDTRRVHREIALALSAPDASLRADDPRFQKIGELIDEWEAEDAGLRERLIEQVPMDIFLQLRAGANYAGFLGMDEAAYLKEILKAKNGVSHKDVVEWICLQHQERVKRSFSDVDLGPIQVSSAADQAWVRADRLFVTVLPKSEPPSALEEKLTAALVDSFPSPHRLLLARMRAVIDDQGSMAELAVLSDSDVQTAWLDDFLNEKPTDEHSAIWSSIQRHWEALGDQLRAELLPFGSRVRAAFLPLGMAVFERCGLKQSALRERDTVLNYNRYISTKSLDRSHLTTGHIFKLGEDYWICLSPACDMVPGQKSKGWPSRLGDATPFLAFRLWPTDGGRAARDATSNNFVFIESGGKTEAFSIYPEGAVKNNPEWEQMFAANHARFDDRNKVLITTTLHSDGKLSHAPADATVVAQLRSEYALNLLQRVGSSLFRPGLGMFFKKAN